MQAIFKAQVLEQLHLIHLYGLCIDGLDLCYSEHLACHAFMTIQAAKYSAKAEDKAAPDPAKVRQYLSSQLLD